jgi:uncharacterized protein (DUF1810 family)
LTAHDPFGLERFVIAQAPVFPAVLTELNGGRKCTHWMWFIFPQLRGLGHSSMAKFYGISSLDEARAYLDHPVLGPRLDLCTRVVLDVENSSLHRIFGSPDDTKFGSSMTLFALAAADEGSPFRQALDRRCDGRMDERTRELLKTGHRD